MPVPHSTDPEPVHHLLASESLSPLPTAFQLEGTQYVNPLPCTERHGCPVASATGRLHGTVSIGTAGVLIPAKSVKIGNVTEIIGFSSAKPPAPEQTRTQVAGVSAAGARRAPRPQRGDSRSGERNASLNVAASFSAC